jgi:hypothetical protein
VAQHQAYRRQTDVEGKEARPPFSQTCRRIKAAQSSITFTGKADVFKKQSKLVISEPDVEDALEHLRGLPYRAQSPMTWDRQHLLTMIRDAVSTPPTVGQTFDVAPGVYGII